MRRGRGVVVLAAVLATGCDRDWWSARDDSEPLLLDLTDARPSVTLRLTGDIGEDGLPGSRLGRAVLEPILTAHAFLDTCEGTDCPAGVELIPLDPALPPSTLPLTPGTNAMLRNELPVFDDCRPRRACTRSVDLELSMIGEDLVEIEVFGRVYVDARGNRPRLTDEEVEATLEILDD